MDYKLVIYLYAVNKYQFFLTRLDVLNVLLEYINLFNLSGNITDIWEGLLWPLPFYIAI